MYPIFLYNVASPKYNTIITPMESIRLILNDIFFFKKYGSVRKKDNEGIIIENTL